MVETYLKTSHDMFYVVLSVCVFVLTFFLCWFLFHLAMSARRVNQISSRLALQIKQLSDFIKNTKEKMEHGTAYLALLIKGAKEIFEKVDKSKRGKNKK